ncbi:Ppx/GppA phosphatase family protein [Rubrimonas cliftonensis]|uniref:Exopolyphosphatase / guanosine-5'-triphosphate,3'-diphosphate pyrophosphatase n=1 Tax=Rubrimonas cliftonensis TaxID=89524 RepID=A0A1H3WR88_9RHOB|nr:Ppx/GppA phosphatase family protein [Rubrimonas cliftonensis]SDZ89687.1 exopolyphosphatase / guanosine-5'-triphosphate,3'-diphosphate pyrophosphatase [Rubrimonas cliftonensis]
MDASTEQAERNEQTRRSGGPGVRAAPLAAVDLGTNNCRLLIARPTPAGFQVVDSFSRAVKLGEGVEESGVLGEVAMRRALDALAVCAEKIRRHGVRRMRAVATEACRRAANRSGFIDRARSRTGLRIDIISAEEEARLAVAGCAPLHVPEADQLMVVDIGGGSTELIWIDLSGTPPHLRGRLLMALAPARRGALEADARARAAAAHIVDWVSAPVGVATLHDRFSRIENPKARFDAMCAAFEDEIRAFAPYGKRRDALGAYQLIGASGTVTTLAGAHLGLRRYDRARVDGMWLPSDGAMAVISQIVALDDDERTRHPFIGPDRSLLLVAGGAILATVLNLWPTERIRVADRGLREGLLYGLIGEGLGSASRV